MPDRPSRSSASSAVDEMRKCDGFVCLSENTLTKQGMNSILNPEMTRGERPHPGETGAVFSITDKARVLFPARRTIFRGKGKPI